MNTPSKVLNFSMEAYSNSNRDTIKKVFDYYFKDKAFDKAFLKKVLYTVIEFETRNEEHVNFLGSNLLGMYKIKHLKSDDEKWLEEVIDIPEWGTLEDEFHDLDSVEKKFLVAGNVQNASYPYIAHRLLTSPSLSKEEQQKGGIAVFKLFHYKFLASLINYFFPYQTQEAVALALYESLSKKSLLKRYHTWGRLVEARSIDSISPDGIHYNTLKNFTPDKGILYVVTDTQSRIREVVKKLNMEYRRLKDEDSRIVSESKYMSNDEGEHVLKDYENKAESLIRETLAVMRDKNDFIRNELVEQTLKLINTADKRYLLIALGAISEAMSTKQGVSIPQAIEGLVVHIQEYRRVVPKGENNIISLVIKLRNMYRSSQLTNPDIVFFKNTLEEIVGKALKNKSSGIIAASRIAAMMYVTLRMLTLNHYN
jgi:hypothetical protein